MSSTPHPTPPPPPPRSAPRDPSGTPPGLTVRTLEGSSALQDLGEALDELHAAIGAPVTARRPWLETWTRCYSDLDPLAVVVEGPDGRLEAAALLARRRAGKRTDVVGLGHGPSDHARLAARTSEAGAVLAQEVARTLEALRGPWTLLVEQVPAEDPVAAGIASRLRYGALVPGDGSPTLPFDEGRSLNSYVSKRSRGVARTMMNRIQKAGMAVSIDHIRDADQIAALLPEVERIHRERDRDLVRKSDLDDPRAAAFWRSVVGMLAGRGELQLTTLHLDGRLVAYEIGLLDRDAYRMWDGRFDPHFARFSPGRLTGQAALASALLEERFLEFDWMRGMEEYKMRLATKVVPAQHLVAWSSRALRARSELPARARATLKGVKDRNRWVQRAWHAVKSRTILREKSR